MKTIKIIDLLNKIANGEEPNIIKYKDKIYCKGKYSNNVFYYTDDKLQRINLTHFAILNDEVEIIEYVEKDKGIKKIDTNIPCSYEIETTLRDKLNEVIDIVNSLNKK